MLEAVNLSKSFDGKAVLTHLQGVKLTDDGKGYVVKAGLSAGDVIVAEGVGMVREGQTVIPSERSELSESK